MKEMMKENRTNAVSAIVYYAWLQTHKDITPIETIVSIVTGEAPTGVTVAFRTLDTLGQKMLLSKLAEHAETPISDMEVQKNSNNLYNVLNQE